MSVPIQSKLIKTSEWIMRMIIIVISNAFHRLKKISIFHFHNFSPKNNNRNKHYLFYYIEGQFRITEKPVLTTKRFSASHKILRQKRVLYLSLFDDHIAITSAQDVANICAPLKDLLGSDFFDFRRIFHDGSRIRLCTNPYWTHHYLLKSELKDRQREDHYLSCIRSSYTLCDYWPETDSTFRVLESMRGFGIDHVLSLIKHYKGYFDCFVFGAPPKMQKINELYLRYLDCLNHFCDYFLVAAHDLINKANKQKYTYPWYQSLVRFDQNTEINQTIEKFYNQTKINRMLLDSHEGEQILLPPKESLVVNLFLKGMTAKEIAKVLKISPYTVESHFRNICEKLGYTNKKSIRNAIQTKEFQTFHF